MNYFKRKSKIEENIRGVINVLSPEGEVENYMIFAEVKFFKYYKQHREIMSMQEAKELSLERVISDLIYETNSRRK